MKTIQLTFDDDLINEVDKAVQKLKTNRLEFTRLAFRWALKPYFIPKTLVEYEN